MCQVKLQKRFWECAITLLESGRILEELQLLGIMTKANVSTISKAFVESQIKQKLTIAMFVLIHKERIVTVESVPQIKKMISKDKSKISDPNILMPLLYKILVLVLTGNVKVLSPLYKKSKMGKWEKWLSNTEIDYVDLLSNSSNRSSIYTPLESWFSIKQWKNPTKNFAKTSSQLSMFTPVERWAKDDTRGKKLTSSIKVRLLPTRQQKQILNKFFGTYRYIYNTGLTVFNDTGKYTKNCLSSFIVSKTARSKPDQQEDNQQEDNREQYEQLIPWWFYTAAPIGIGRMPDWSYNTPSTIRKKALDELESNVKSGFTNKTNGNIHRFRIRYKSKKRLQKEVMGEEHLTSRIRRSKRSYFLDISKLKGLRMVPKTNKELNACQQPLINDIKIMRTKSGQYFAILCPKETVDTPKRMNTVCGLDPGFRTFITGIDLNGNKFDIGDDVYSSIKRLKWKYSLLSSHIALSGYKKSNAKSYKEYKQYRTYCYLVKQRNLVLNKIANCIKELHSQTINYLVKQYDVIILGKLDIQSILKSSTSSSFRKMVLSLNHYTFRKRLQDKCDRLNKTLQITNEAYTSQTCFRCSNRKLNLFTSKTYDCSQCGFVCDRDLNGASNILKYSLLDILR